MKHLHVIPHVRGDLAKALASCEALWPWTVVVDNTPDGHDTPGMSGREGVQVTRLEPHRRTAPGTLNWALAYAGAHGSPTYSWQHDDAFFLPGECQRFLAEVIRPLQEKKSHIAVFTDSGYGHEFGDQIACFCAELFDKSGQWREDFPSPSYYYDTEFYERCDHLGLRVAMSDVRCEHDAGSTMRRDKDYAAKCLEASPASSEMLMRILAERGRTLMSHRERLEYVEDWNEVRGVTP